MILKIIKNTIEIVLITIAITAYIADINYKNDNYYLAHKLNPFEPRYEMKNLIYKESPNYLEIKDFYIKNEKNPYVAEYILLWTKKNLTKENIFIYQDMLKIGMQNYPQNENIKTMYDEIYND